MVKEIKKVVLADEVDTKAHYKVDEVINSLLDYIGEDIVGLRASHVLDYKTKILPICQKLMSRLEWDEDADTINGYGVVPTLIVFCISRNLFENDDVLYHDLVACELNGEKPTVRYEFFKANFALFLDRVTFHYQYSMEYLLETFEEFFDAVFEDVAYIDDYRCANDIPLIRHFGGYGYCEVIYERIHKTILNLLDDAERISLEKLKAYLGNYSNLDEHGKEVDTPPVITTSSDYLRHVDSIVKHGCLAKDEVPAFSQVIYGLLIDEMAIYFGVFHQDD